jgi:hypothetical protein
MGGVMNGRPAHFRPARELESFTSAVRTCRTTATQFTLSDAQLTIAREYAFGSWAGLRSYLQESSP